MCAKNKTRLVIDLDDAAMARLMEIADLCHQDPELIAASMISDVLEDDFRAHAEQVPSNLTIH